MKFISIVKLDSVNSLEKIQALNAVGIYTIRDLAEFEGCRHAELILAYSEKDSLDELDLAHYIEADIDETYLLNIAQASMNDLIAITDEFYTALTSAFAVETIRDLATFAPYLEARAVVRENLLGAFYEKPSAPEALLPKIIGSTHTQVRFSNYVKEKEKILNDYVLNYYPDSDEPDPAIALIEIFYQSTIRFYLGYLGAIQQKWINGGTHLGEPLHSIALAPGESRNIAIIDWYQRQISSRDEDTTVSERLSSEFVQTRALNEVVQTTANEHLAGGTEIDANTKTTGYGLVGGMGMGNAQGMSNATSGSASFMGPFYDMLVGGTLSGTMGSGMVSSMAGSLGGSLVHSKGTVQGTLKSETSGEREVMGQVVQDITDSTVQNSASVRSVMSTVVVEDRQSGRQRAQTRNITNYNHSHALTMMYYEVLQTYRIKTGVDTLTPVLFLPFKPINFNIEIIQQYWYLFGKAIRQTHPKKFYEYSQVVKDFDPNNSAFDATENVLIDSIRITRTKNFTSDVRIEFTHADPYLNLAIAGPDLNDSLELSFSGAVTYVAYEVLEPPTSSYFTKFGTLNAFEIDENIVAKIKSDFKDTLVKTMKDYLDDKNKTPRRRSEIGREDNELGAGHNRNKLKDQVDDGYYKLLNANEQVELTLEIEYDLRDQNEQHLTLNQSITIAFTFDELYEGMDKEISNITDYINTQLNTVADINPTDVIEELEGHFRFHQYAYTKYLLAHLEKEQIIDTIEHLGLSGGAELIPLTAIIDPNPLGITENLLIFKLKEPDVNIQNTLGERFNALVKFELMNQVDRMGGTGFKKPVMRHGRNTMMYQLEAQQLPSHSTSLRAPAHSTRMTLYIDRQATDEDRYPVEGKIDVITLKNGITKTLPITISGMAKEVEGNTLNITYRIDSIFGDITPDHAGGDLDISLEYSPVDQGNVTDSITQYQQSVAQYEEQMRARPVWSTVFLPTTGVFGEAILGVSNASEYINPRRFFNWQDSPIPNLAPAIQSVNANQDYTQPVSDSINPTVPVSVLNQISPQTLPGTSLGTALQAIQNGSMFNDMSKTEQLTTVLGTLAELANNTAQLSGNLAGDAAANSLNAAVALGQQVASMIGAAMGTNIASPPETPTGKGIALAILDGLSPAPTPKEQAEAGVGGVQLPGQNNNGSGGTGGGSSGDGGNGGSGGGSDNGDDSTDDQDDQADGAAFNTQEEISGALNVSVGLPTPYQYLSVNSLAMIDEIIPEEVDENIYAIYTTIKDLIIWVGDDEQKKNMAVGMLLSLKTKLSASGWGLVISLLIDVLTSETFIEVAEEVLILLYNVVYYFAFPTIGFSGHLAGGTWMESDIYFTKKKGEPAQVSNLSTAPFNTIKYYFGGTPYNSTANAPFWGIETLLGGIYLSQTVTPASNLSVTATDRTSGDGVIIQVEAHEEVIIDLVSIAQSLRDYMSSEINRIWSTWQQEQQDKIQELIEEFIKSLDESSLDSLLDATGFSETVKDAIKTAIATGASIFGALASYFISGLDLLVQLNLFVLDHIFLIKDLVGMITCTYEVTLQADIIYDTSYPEGWRLQVQGETGKFPALTVAYDISSDEGTLYQSDVYPQGIIGLLFSNDAVPLITRHLTS